MCQPHVASSCQLVFLGPGFTCSCEYGFLEIHPPLIKGLCLSCFTEVFTDYAHLVLMMFQHSRKVAVINIIIVYLLGLFDYC